MMNFKKIMNMFLFITILLTFSCVTLYYSVTTACSIDDFVNENSSTLNCVSEDSNINLTYLPEEVPDGNSSFSDAISIKEGVTYTYDFQNENDIDYYCFSSEFANYYTITSLNNSFDVNFYSKDKEHLKYISYSNLNTNAYVYDFVYITLCANGSNGNYSFSINKNNTYEGMAYYNVKSEKKFYGIKRGNLTTLTYINVFIDQTMAAGYSSVADYPMLTLYYDAVREINKLGYIRFKESKENEASIKIYYGENKADGTKLEDKVLGNTTYNFGYKKIKSSTIVFNSSRFSGNKSSNFKEYKNALCVVIHELLHSIGINHMESANEKSNKKNVMYYSILEDNYEKFGAFDIASYRKLWG